MNIGSYYHILFTNWYLLAVEGINSNNLENSRQLETVCLTMFIVLWIL